jgi:hypothetical protein
MANSDPVHPRIVISSLWATMLFVFAYVDIFALFRADVLEQALAGRVAVFDVSQTFLALTTLYVVIPSLMIFLTMVLPRGINRAANIVLAGLYILTIAASCVGETWIYFWIGSLLEVALLLEVARRAWKTL